MKLVAVYGTLKRGKYYHSQFAHAKFIQEDILENAQLYVNQKQYTHIGWPILTIGKNNVEVELYEVPDNLFESQKHGEERSGYETKLVKLQSGQEAYMWFYQLSQVTDEWQKVDKY